MPVFNWQICRQNIFLLHSRVCSYVYVIRHTGCKARHLSRLWSVVHLHGSLSVCVCVAVHLSGSLSVRDAESYPKHHHLFMLATAATPWCALSFMMRHEKEGKGAGHKLTATTTPGWKDSATLGYCSWCIRVVGRVNNTSTAEHIKHTSCCVRCTAHVSQCCTDCVCVCVFGCICACLPSCPAVVGDGAAAAH